MLNKKFLSVFFIISFFFLIIPNTSFSQWNIPTPLGSTEVWQALKNDLDGSGKWNQISFADGTTQTTAASSSPIGSSSDTEILYNNSSVLDGMSFFTTDGTDVTLDGIFNIQNTAGNTGIVFSSLGTATIGIDMSGCGLTTTDKILKGVNSNSYIDAAGKTQVVTLGWSNATFQYNDIYLDLNNTRLLNPGIALRAMGSLGNGIVLTTFGSIGGVLMGIDDPKIGSWINDGVSNGTTTITDVGGAAHGLSLAVGDCVHIANSTTAADEGFYSIVSDDGTSVVIDRALSGSDTDLLVHFYKDVIYFGGTDGTNGQRIMNYSHQDKPLQIGGDTLSAANAAMGSEDIVIGNHVEVKGLAFVSSSTFTFTTEGDITDPLPSTQLLLDGDNDTENDTIDLQDGEAAGQLLTLIAAVDIDANDTVTISFADTTATNAPAIVFDKVGENAELEWTDTTWIVKSLQTSL